MSLTFDPPARGDGFESVESRAVVDSIIARHHRDGVITAITVAALRAVASGAGSSAPRGSRAAATVRKRRQRELALRAADPHLGDQLAEAS